MNKPTEILKIYSAKNGVFPSVYHNDTPIRQCLADNHWEISYTNTTVRIVLRKHI